MDDQFQPQDKQVLHQLHKSPLVKVIAFFFVIMLLGIGSGYVISHITNKSTVATSTTAGGATQVVKGAVYGSDDTKTFSDTATGVLQKGGIEGEGQYHLVRPGGDSQNVYMTSAVVDLSQFIGKKVTVHGQTQKAQHAGWLMDVGRVEVLD